MGTSEGVFDGGVLGDIDVEDEGKPSRYNDGLSHNEVGFADTDGLSDILYLLGLPLGSILGETDGIIVGICEIDGG